MTYNIVIGVILFLSASYTFLKQGTVPNVVPIMLMAIFGISIAVLSDAPALAPQLLACAGIFVLGFICFVLWSRFGGGTAKVFAVIGLLTPVSLLPYTVAGILVAYVVSIIADTLFWKVLKGEGDIMSYFASLSLAIAAIIMLLPVLGVDMPNPFATLS